MKKILRTKGENETIEIAENFTEELLKTPEDCKIVFLEGELGAGKTIFAKGVAKVLGISKTVESPTFVFLREYSGGKEPLFHFDLYRINNPNELDELGFFEYLSKSGIVLIEWAEKVEQYVKPTAIVKIKKIGISEREIQIEYA